RVSPGLQRGEPQANLLCRKDVDGPPQPVGLDEGPSLPESFAEDLSSSVTEPNAGRDLGAAHHLGMNATQLAGQLVDLLGLDRGRQVVPDETPTDDLGGPQSRDVRGGAHDLAIRAGSTSRSSGSA